MRHAKTGCVRLGLIAVAALGLAGCSWMSGGRSRMAANPPPTAPAAAPMPAQPTAPVAPVTIRDVQTALQQNGFYQHQAVDGVWGPRTERAVRAFQRAHQLNANGQLDVPTLQAMNLTGAPPPNAPSAQGSGSANGGNAPAANQPADNQQPDNTPPPSAPPNMPSAPPSGTGNNNNNR